MKLTDTQKTRLVCRYKSGESASSICNETGIHMDPYRKALYIFCGRRRDRIKVLLWEGDGVVLLYKLLASNGSYRWPRTQSEVRNLTWQQFDWLMSGLEIDQPKAIKPCPKPEAE